MTDLHHPHAEPRTSARPVRGLLPVVCALLLAACGGAEAEDASTELDEGTTITMRSNSFEPSTATVTVGEEVTFENADGYDHNVRGEGIDIDDFSSGSQTVTVGEAGTIDYECTIHEGMTGTLEVEEPQDA